METDFKVKVGEFEGPLELLLDLIEKRKLHISDVSLSQVADEFTAYTRMFEDFPIADSADFILIASTLLLIKSKSLLPNLALSEEEKESIEELEERLSLYKKYREISLGLAKMFGNFMYFANDRPSRKVDEHNRVFSPTNEVNLKSLQEALSNTINNLPAGEPPLPKVSVEKIISLEEMIDRLSKKIENSLKTSFREFTKGNAGEDHSKAEKINVIVTFLAMLELVKQGLIRVSQESHFDDISIESDNLSVPKY